MCLLTKLGRLGEDASSSKVATFTQYHELINVSMSQLWTPVATDVAAAVLAALNLSYSTFVLQYSRYWSQLPAAEQLRISNGTTRLLQHASKAATLDNVAF